MKRFLRAHLLLVLSLAALLAFSVGSTLGLAMVWPRGHQSSLADIGTRSNSGASQQGLTEKETPPPAPVNYCSQNSSGKLLLVSISRQHVWACDGTTLTSESAVTTGASGLTNVDDATPTGTWKIYSKQTNTTLKGCDVNGCWNDPVAYWMPFDDQIGFHDASWQTFPFGSDKYKTEGSHGCVHLPADYIAWVYNWAPIGTTVTVQA